MNEQEKAGFLGLEAAGVNYCTLHDGVCNEDEPRCDMLKYGVDGVAIDSPDFDEDANVCVLVPCYYFKPQASVPLPRTPDTIKETHKS